MKKIVGLGNALTDILIHIGSDAVLEEFGLRRGSMNLVDTKFQKELSEYVSEMPHALSVGGSTSNTIRSMARFGIQTGYIGKVGTDTTGDFFRQAMDGLGIRSHILNGTLPSGRCISLISPDGERTMCTYLGAAIEMQDSEIVPDMLAGFDCLYVEGFQVQNRELITGIVRLAREMGMQVAMDLASYNIVEENLGFLKELAAGYVDIIFANELEAEAFTGHSNPLEALDALSHYGKNLTIVKAGAEGAYMKYQGEVDHTGVLPGIKCIDSTGAGDLYSAGFLTGLCRGLTVRQCAIIGAVAGGKCTEVDGTTFPEELWDEIRTLARQVEEGTFKL